MNIVCTICCDLVNSADLCTTKCGHLFHQACVNQWLARSQSCPQCRSSITSKCIFRLYVTTPDEDAPGNDDAASSQSKLGDTRSDLLLLQCSFQKLTICQFNLEETTNLLKDAKEKLKKRDSEIAVCRKRITSSIIEHIKLRKEFEQYQKKMQPFQGLQTLLYGTVQEFENFLNSRPDLQITYARALEKASCESEAKRTELCNKLQATTENLAAKLGGDTENDIPLNEHNGAASSKIPISRHLVPKRPNSDEVPSIMLEFAKKPRLFDK